MGIQVYISSHKRNKKIIKKIITNLENVGFFIVDGVSITDFQQISMRISNSSIFIVLLSSENISSDKFFEEIKLAKRFIKPIIPLQVDKIEVPKELSGRSIIKFDIKELNIDCSKIIQHINWLLSEKGEIQVLRDRLNDLINYNEDINQSSKAAIKKEIEYLEKNIFLKENPEENITNEVINKEKERFRKTRIRLRMVGTSRVIGVPPLGKNSYFQDRVEVLANILDFINSNNSSKVITIYGKGGIGKTALSCEAMSKMLESNFEIFGYIFLSTRNYLGINLEQIFLSIANIMDDTDNSYLKKIWTEINDPQVKIEILLEKIERKKLIILLDNFEDLLDFNGYISDEHLNLFLSLFLKSNHLSKIIITSRERMRLSNNVRVYMDYIPLDQGIPVSEAVILLKSYDKDGFLRIRDLDDKTLELLAKKANGYPRALEAIAGILEQDPLISPNEIIYDDSIYQEEVVELLVGDAFSRLNKDAEYVMQALSVFNRPATINSIKYLLEPFISTNNIELTIDKLARGKFIYIFPNTGEIVIHSLDREYCYNKIPK